MFARAKWDREDQRAHPATAPQTAISGGAPASGPARFDTLRQKAGPEAGIPGAVPGYAQIFMDAADSTLSSFTEIATVRNLRWNGFNG